MPPATNGYDEAYAKDRYYLQPLRQPPYYAMKCDIALRTTHGGIRNNRRAEVLDRQNEPIGGLYAVGVETGGTDSDTYNVILSGHSFGFSLNTGRIAGDEASRHS